MEAVFSIRSLSGPGKVAKYCEYYYIFWFTFFYVKPSVYCLSLQLLSYIRILNLLLLVEVVYSFYILDRSHNLIND